MIISASAYLVHHSWGLFAMNIDNFDKHAKANLAIYENVMNFSKIVTVAVIVTLVLMAIFLV